MGKVRLRYVAQGVPGGYRIKNTKTKKFWGDRYDYCPDDLLVELNGEKRPSELIKLINQARADKR